MSNKELLKFKIPERGFDRLIYQFSTAYADPLKALREYLTNAVDALDERNGRNEDGLIKVLCIQQDRRLVVADNAAGMSHEKLTGLPENVGYSDKYDQLDKRGEKAIGLFAFGSIGDMLHVISKRAEDSEYGYLRYEKTGRIIVPTFEKLSKSNVDREFYGSFHHGTKIIIDVNPYLLKNNLTEDAIENFIQETYFPLLFDKSKKIKFMVNAPGQNYFRTVGIPSSFESSIRLLEKKIEFQVQKSRETEIHDIFAYLVFHPDRDNGKVSVFSKDIKVYDSILNLEKRLGECALWKCRFISGFINQPTLEIVLGREGLNKNTKTYEALISLFENIHKQYWPQIEVTVRNSRKEMSNQDVLKAWKKIERAYVLTDPLDKKTRIPNINPQPNPNPPQPGPPKGGGRKFPFGMPRIEDFGLAEEKFRSRLDDSNPDCPIVVINSAIDSYRRNILEAKDTRQKLEYILDVMAPQMALFEIRKGIHGGASYGDSDAIAMLIARRAQDIKYSILNRSAD